MNCVNGTDRVSECLIISWGTRHRHRPPRRCIYTEPWIKACTWLREISLCSCLTVVPGPTWLLLNSICISLFRALYMAYQDIDWKYVFDVNISKAKITTILDTRPKLWRSATSPEKELSDPALNWALIRFRRKRKHFVAMQIFAHGEQRRRGKETDRRALKRSRELNLWSLPFNPLSLSNLLTLEPPL